MSTPALRSSTLNVCRNSCEDPSTPAALKTRRYSLSKVLTAPFGVASPETKKYLEFPFLTASSSLPSQEGMTLLTCTPVLCHWVTTRKVLPSRKSSSLRKQTASTKLRPDHLCSCISALTRAALRGVIFVLLTAAMIRSYSFGSNGRTEFTSSALTWIGESWAAGFAGIIPASYANLK